MKNEGFSSDFKDACYADHSKCQFGHNPPLKESNFMNLANLETFKDRIEIQNTFDKNIAPSMNIDITGALFTLSLNRLILNSKCKEGASQCLLRDFY